MQIAISLRVNTFFKDSFSAEHSPLRTYTYGYHNLSIKIASISRYIFVGNSELPMYYTRIIIHYTLLRGKEVLL